MTFECEVCPDEIKQKHCVSDGIFCFTPPNADVTNLYPQMTDRQLIDENLRERCIYTAIGEWEDEFDDHIFFNYLHNIHLSCLKGELQITKECAEKQMADLGIPVDLINECMIDSFEIKGAYSSYNDMLFDDREATTDLGI